MAANIADPELQAPPYPCGDLLDGRKDYLDIAVPLYRALIRGGWEAADTILDNDERNLVRYSITEKKDTPLHVAAARERNIQFPSKLLGRLKTADFELQNADGNTAFCVAAISGNVDMAKEMFRRNNALQTICGNDNKLPLYLAAYHGKHDVVKFLYEKSDKMTGECWTNDSRNGVFMKCIESDIFDVALRILNDNDELPHENYLRDVLHVLARKHKAFRVETQSVFTQYINFIKSALGQTEESDATLLLRLLWHRIMQKPKADVDNIIKGPIVKDHEIETYPSPLLFVAAKMNNTGFLVELIREYPDLIWTRNDDGQTIFHVAVAHRHQDIYDLLYQTGSMRDRITSITDNQKNNILHIVGNDPEINVDHQRVTSQMFSELVWYKKVEDILPPPCREVKNEAGQTPLEVFIENHKDLSLQSVARINETINQSMVVAALVCTIGFSVLFSIPGGFDQNNGYPVFHNKKFFIAFVVMDAMSFISATVSILNYLTIIVSGHRQNLDSLYINSKLGHALLFYSVFFLIMAFIIGFFVLYEKSKWTFVIYPYALLMILLATRPISSIFDDIAPLLSRKRPPKYMLFGK